MCGDTGKRHPFRRERLRRPTPFHRMFDRPRRRNALVELNNALAEAVRIRDVPETLVYELNRKYQLDLQRVFRRRLERMYREFILFCMQDERFDDDEVEDLSHLQLLFGISNPRHNEIYLETAEEKYGKTVDEVLADGRVTDAEKARLERMRKDLEIPESTAARLLQDKGGKVLAKRWQEAVDDGLLSPEEERELDALAKRLGIEVHPTEKSREEIERCRWRWRIVNGTPPQIPVSIHLPRGEVCYFKTDVAWYELRRVTRRIRYGGPTMRIKLMKGVYWRMGDLGVRSVSEDVMTRIDEGTVYVTNRRLLFRGERKNTSIRLSKILDITPHRNGVEIEKDTGRSPFLEFHSDVDIFCAALTRAIEDAIR